MSNLIWDTLKPHNESSAISSRCVRGDNTMGPPVAWCLMSAIPGSDSTTQCYRTHARTQLACRSDESVERTTIFCTFAWGQRVTPLWMPVVCDWVQTYTSTHAQRHRTVCERSANRTVQSANRGPASSYTTDHCYGSYAYAKCRRIGG